ncbi:uncharacterized protein, YigZ family [Izhakiella capsodis]|uniref:Uncharacterized protein, YigZ family n=1 Tax=Izhakiella capsodis TaxID=1367852 RepID=A0A1I4ZJQ0_9GAMM|nr:IMPACT family protein [Izhakiella capsodis]SFN50189.1 uncharacterized protein, YigZ family [Izhakiella capsodis]
MDAYDIPAEAVSFSEEIKKSRFITLLQHTEGVEAARSFVQVIREQHPDARHHCWAWVAGAPIDSQKLGFSDDGEPSGTAGKPMLAQLMGSGIGEITAVIIRYYGGIQLGTGGLVRAYGNGVQQALKLLKRQLKMPMLSFHLYCDYSQLADIERLIRWASGSLVSSDFTDRVVLRLALPFSQVNGFKSRLTDLSRGTLSIKPLDQ